MNLVGKGHQAQFSPIYFFRAVSHGSQALGTAYTVCLASRVFRAVFNEWSGNRITALPVNYFIGLSGQLFYTFTVKSSFQGNVVAR